MADNYKKDLGDIIKHCWEPENKGFTPNDFPLSKLSQSELDNWALADIIPDEVENIYPLSPMQEGMLFHTIYAPNSEVYITQMSVDLLGVLDYSIFKKSWQHIF